MKGSTLAWSALALAAGALLASGRFPGAGGMAAGPRIGVATTLLVLGLFILLASNAAWILRKTTRPEDYQGGCPVGARCACGHFNLKPRKACRQCGAATLYPS